MSKDETRKWTLEVEVVELLAARCDQVTMGLFTFLVLMPGWDLVPCALPCYEIDAIRIMLLAMSVVMGLHAAHELICMHSAQREP